MASPRALLVLIAAAFALAGCGESDAAFGDRVHAYLLSHPEVIQEAVAKLQAKQQAQAATDAKALIEQHRQAIEHDPRDFVANPGGKITMTEFYDYRCAHCINIAPSVLALIQSDPDLRVVFKEFPIFGEASERGAVAALDVKQAGGDYLAVYHDFMTTHPLDQPAIDRILKAHGVDPASLDQAAFKQSATAQLGDVRKLAVDLGIEGTPAFIIGDTLIPGEDIDAIKAAITSARAGKG
jgi:protein-disulfide isomerase